MAEGFLAAHLARLRAGLEAAAALEAVAEAYADRVLETIRGGGRILLFGNGGSAAMAEHVAAEYVVRFRRERRALPAVALTAGSPLLTAAANDLGYEEALSRIVRGMARPGDLLVLHSTSGESENLVRAAVAAREMGVSTVGVLARGGGRLGGLVDLAVVVPAEDTALAQEMQLALEHAVVDRVEEEVARSEGEEEDAG
ncbi:MAG TPA: SIS domain-containing protein [Gemmatimonadota bacterium]|nr:SIS domain-containing protein [Gemmatimonadota bacterium]